jgi:hypothetical protein
MWKANKKECFGCFIQKAGDKWNWEVGSDDHHKKDSKNNARVLDNTSRRGLTKCNI